MANKLETFLNDNKIDQRRLVSASRSIERLRPEDRKILLTRKQARNRDDGKKTEAGTKSRSGRGVSQIGLSNAFADKPVSGPQKNRILRAVNHLLVEKKKEAIQLDSLF